MRFMTLTTASGVDLDINHSFDVLKERIKRASISNSGFHGFKFNRYFKLKTAEGNNVLHIVYWGRFIPQDWLSKAWSQIHGSPIVDIRACWGSSKRNVKGLVGYLLTNYLTKQPILRMSYGWKWAWLGFCKSWQHVKQTQSLLRRCGKLSDKLQYFNDVPSYSRISKIAGILSFKYRYRNVVLDYWRALTVDPLPSSRQLKFCNPDHSRWRVW